VRRFFLRRVDSSRAENQPFELEPQMEARWLRWWKSCIRAVNCLIYNI
jgi:hypothetical protein